MTVMDTTPLAVPDAACDALHATTGRERVDARAVAAPVVAAELRRLAVESFRNGELGETLRARMVVRADEIERARDGETP